MLDSQEEDVVQVKLSGVWLAADAEEIIFPHEVA